MGIKTHTSAVRCTCVFDGWIFAAVRSGSSILLGERLLHTGTECNAKRAFADRKSLSSTICAATQRTWKLAHLGRLSKHADPIMVSCQGLDLKSRQVTEWAQGNL